MIPEFFRFFLILFQQLFIKYYFFHLNRHL